MNEVDLLSILARGEDSHHQFKRKETNASIRLMMCPDCVEIISTGHLPDGLNTEQIRQGKSNRRNPTLIDHAVLWCQRWHPARAERLAANHAG